MITQVISTHLIGISIYIYRRRQDLELFTQRQKTEQALKELSISEQRERDISAAKTRLIGSVSHDLRQPLNSLSLYNNLLRSQPANARISELGDISERIEACLGAMEGNLVRLQEIAQLQARAVSVPLSAANLRQSVLAAKNVFDPIAESAGVRFKVSFGCNKDVLLHTNADRLFEILANLLSNAIKFSALQSGRPAWVLLRTSLRGSEGDQAFVRIDVRDNGVGIAQTDQQRIFDEYVQLNNPERQSARGYGLGLSVVRELCDSMFGHRVVVRSRPGHGACFSLWIPVANEAAAEQSAASTATSPTESVAANTSSEPLASTLAGAEVLLIEDDENLRHAITRHLTAQGATVRSYSCALKALAATANDFQSPTCIISDYWLPAPHNGIQAIQLLRSQFGEPVPALLVSAAAGNDPALALRPPDIDFAAKPVPASVLSAYVEKHHRLK